MPALQALISSAPGTAMTVGGALIGVLFGGLLQRTNYCVMGAVSDWQLSANLNRLGAVALGAATAILLVQMSAAAGLVDLSRTMYLTPRINWAGAIGGGLLFGIGMVYAGGCPSRSLVRAGGGDFRAVVSLMALGIAAYATISGVLGSFRTGLDTATAIDLRSMGWPTQSLPDALRTLAVPGEWARAIATSAVAIPLLVFSVGPGKIFHHPRNLVAGLSVGALAAAGWVLTGLAADDIAANPVVPQSLSFVRPVADAIDWIERSTALGLPGFGAASVFGVAIGGLIAAMLSTHGVRYSGFVDGRDLARHLAGAVAMGIGGVLALGCSIGQGVSGISTLSIQSILACAAIVSGAVLGLKLMARSV